MPEYAVHYHSTAGVYFSAQRCDFTSQSNEVATITAIEILIASGQGGLSGVRTQLLSSSGQSDLLSSRSFTEVLVRRYYYARLCRYGSRAV